jgi:hypothetical protein
MHYGWQCCWPRRVHRPGRTRTCLVTRFGSSIVQLTTSAIRSNAILNGIRLPTTSLSLVVLVKKNSEFVHYLWVFFTILEMSMFHLFSILTVWIVSGKYLSVGLSALVLDKNATKIRLVSEPVQHHAYSRSLLLVHYFMFFNSEGNLFSMF